MVGPGTNPSAFDTEVLEILRARIRAAVLLPTLGAAARRSLRAGNNRVVHVVALRASSAALAAEVLGADELVIARLCLIMVGLGSSCPGGIVRRGWYG